MSDKSRNLKERLRLLPGALSSAYIGLGYHQRKEVFRLVKAGVPVDDAVEEVNRNADKRQVRRRRNRT